MSATNDLGTIICGQDLPVELVRLPTTAHPGEEPRVASMLSGLVTARQQDEVICPLMVQRRLVIPSRYESLSPNASRIG
jgi:hypothetical protein